MPTGPRFYIAFNYPYIYSQQVVHASPVPGEIQLHLKAWVDISSENHLGNH